MFTLSWCYCAPQSSVNTEDILHQQIRNRWVFEEDNIFRPDCIGWGRGMIASFVLWQTTSTTAVIAIAMASICVLFWYESPFLFKFHGSFVFTFTTHSTATELGWISREGKLFLNDLC
jgi:hypothetical protein